MKRFFSVLKWDILLQHRYGVYVAGILITLLWVASSWLIPSGLVSWLPMILLIDVSIIGFFFIGGIVLFEKDENVIESLIITPVRIWQYLLSKTITLTAVAILAGLLITAFAYGFSFNVLYLFIGIALTSIFYVLVGFIAVVRFNTLKAYISSALIYFLVLQLPLLDFYGVLKGWWSYIIPTRASLVLMNAAFNPVFTPYLFYSIFYLVLSIIFVYIWAHHLFYKYVVLNRT